MGDFGRPNALQLAMKRVSTKLEFMLLAVGVPGLVSAIELRSGTLKAWEDYVRTVGLRMQARLDAQRPFLWTDESPDRGLRIRRGEILVAPVVGKGTQNVPDGLIHDWIGAVFIPNATFESLFAVVHDYDRYKEIYKPVVADSKVHACTPADQEFSMTWQRRVLFVNAAMEGQYKAHDFAVDARRGYNVAYTTQVQEIEDYGHSGEQLLPPGQGKGFIWRLHSIARYEERDEGVYLELEAIVLTRDIPASLRWMVNPVVNRLSIDSLTTTLRQTRDAVNSLAARPEPLVSCPNRGRNSANPKPVRTTVGFGLR
jgi:hypothetical protein